MNDNKKNRLIAFLLLLLFLSFQGGRTLCYHTHVFGNVVVSHSHPLNGHNSNHTAEELISIASVSLSMLTDDSAAKPELSAPEVLTIDLTTRVTVGSFDSFDASISGRDPPALHV